MDINKIYNIFVRWNAQPRPKDAPQNEKEFCERYSITPQDLASFTSRPEYPDDLLNKSLNWAKSKTPELLQLMYNELKLSKNVTDLDRFLTVIHEIKKKDKNANTINNFFLNNISDSQYNEIIRREAGSISSGGSETPIELLPVGQS